jgi:hypothetical protein
MKYTPEQIVDFLMGNQTTTPEELRIRDEIARRIDLLAEIKWLRERHADLLKLSQDDPLKPRER